MCQISSVMAAAEGPVAEFSGFANFEEKKRKSNLSMSFPKIVNLMGSFGQKRKKMFFRFCRPILDIFGFTLLSTCSILLAYRVDSLVPRPSNSMLRRHCGLCSLRNKKATLFGGGGGNVSNTLENRILLPTVSQFCRPL